MDPAGKDIPMETAIQMMNDQAHYEVRRNICLGVLLYFGLFTIFTTDDPAPIAWDFVATGLGLN